MRVYKVHPPDFNPCIFTSLSETLEEIKVLLEGGEDIDIRVLEMSEDEIAKMPEHQGY